MVSEGWLTMAPLASTNSKFPVLLELDERSFVLRLDPLLLEELLEMEMDDEEV